jgi:hypothetical protein
MLLKMLLILGGQGGDGVGLTPWVASRRSSPLPLPFSTLYTRWVGNENSHKLIHVRGRNPLEAILARLEEREKPGGQKPTRRSVE